MTVLQPHSRCANSVVTLTAILLCLLLASGSTVAAPRVAATIRPLQFIAAAITDGISEVALILGAGQDPHEIALRPSERRAVADADIVLWVGPALELPLSDLLSVHDGKVLTLQEMRELTLIETASGPDPHLWLNPQQALLIARSLQQTLTQLDTVNAEHYANNLTAFAWQLETVDTEIRNGIARINDSRWAVEHHAYRYFEAAYDLPEPLVLKESDNREPGLRTVTAFRNRLQDSGLTCIVAEPGANADELRTLLGNDDLEIRVVDPLGLEIPVSANAFTTLIAQLAANLLSCMGGTDG